VLAPFVDLEGPDRAWARKKGERQGECVCWRRRPLPVSLFFRCRARRVEETVGGLRPTTHEDCAELHERICKGTVLISRKPRRPAPVERIIELPSFRLSFYGA
jgi:hypothetical protein